MHPMSHDSQFREPRGRIGQARNMDYSGCVDYNFPGSAVEALLDHEPVAQLNTLKNPHENPHENCHEPKFEKETYTNFLTHKFFGIRF